MCACHGCNLMHAIHSNSSLPAYHIYASPERFRSGLDAAADTPLSIFPHPFSSCESGALETAESAAATDGDTSVATDEDAETAVSWVAADALNFA